MPNCCAVLPAQGYSQDKGSCEPKWNTHDPQQLSCVCSFDVKDGLLSPLQRRSRTAVSSLLKSTAAAVFNASL
jgi:hypothetical protein